MAFRIEYTHLAQADLDTLLTWLIEQHAGEAGLRWLNGLQAAVETLREMPHRCPLLRSDPRISFEVRRLFYGRKPHAYRVLFRIIDDTVFILRIRHGRQKPSLQ
jgi:plasmid stabilization system protein ParE